MNVKLIFFCFLTAGLTFQKFNRQFQYTVAILVYGVLSIITPMLRGMKAFSFVYALSGCSSAYIDIATNVWILELFANGNVNLFMQTVYFVFALGQIGGPLMLNSYLAPEANITDPVARHQHYVDNSHIQLPFTIGGGLFIFCSIGMALCWLYRVKFSLFLNLINACLSFICLWSCCSAVHCSRTNDRRQRYSSIGVELRQQNGCTKCQRCSTTVRSDQSQRC